MKSPGHLGDRVIYERSIQYGHIEDQGLTFSELYFGLNTALDLEAARKICQSAFVSF